MRFRLGDINFLKYWISRRVDNGTIVCSYKYVFKQRDTYERDKSVDEKTFKERFKVDLARIISSRGIVKVRYRELRVFASIFGASFWLTVIGRAWFGKRCGE